MLDEFYICCIPILQRSPPPALPCAPQAGDTKRAIDCCVLLNQWDAAVRLAEAHNFPQITGLLSRWARGRGRSGALATKFTCNARKRAILSYDSMCTYEHP